LVRPTNGNESLSWPTAASRDWKGPTVTKTHPAGFNSCLPNAVKQWPTPDTCSRGDGPSQLQRNSPTLQTAVQWPTPTVQEAEKTSNQPNYGQLGLSNHPSIVGLPDREKRSKSGRSQEQWPTPAAVPYGTNQGGAAGRTGKVRPSLESANRAQGKLSPNWVEQLMGLEVGLTQLPTEWTDCG
jgi:hypothetical protein